MSGNGVDGVREVSAAEAVRLQAVGLVADLSRDAVISHVGKPVGSITGWVGPIFWQVWSDPHDEPGVVHARVEQRDAATWRLDATADKTALLAQAQDRLIAEVQTMRRARLTEARARLASLDAKG